MSPAVYVDANISIYAAARDHPLKELCARIPRMVAKEPQPLITDSEVLQELMHRSLTLNRGCQQLNQPSGNTRRKLFPLSSGGPNRRI